MTNSYRQSRQNVLDCALHVLDCHNHHAFNPSPSRASAAALCAVLAPGGPVWHLRPGRPGGLLLSFCLGRFCSAITHKLSQARPHPFELPSWAAEVGAMLEQATVVLLDYSHAPESDALRKAARSTLGLASERVDVLGAPLDEQLAKLEEAVTEVVELIDMRDDRRHPATKRLAALLHSIQSEIVSLERGLIFDLTPTAERATLRWISEVHSTLLASLRRPSFFTPAGLGSDAAPIVARHTALLSEVPRLNQVSPSARLATPDLGCCDSSSDADTLVGDEAECAGCDEEGPLLRAVGDNRRPLIT